MSGTPFKVLITTSGTGSRLGDITKYTNKSLVKVGRKPAISYIIEAYPPEVEFVVTIGYFGDQVKDFLQLVYPDRQFHFVEVEKYQGEGSSLAYSMLHAADSLQCPFIYHACDTLVTEPIPAPEQNWIGGYKGQGSSHYASFDIVDGIVPKIYDKGMLNPDFLHIGLVGIKDYAAFWNAKKSIYESEPQNASLGDIHTISNLLENGVPFKVNEFKIWHDIGNVESLNTARDRVEDSFHILDKLGESIFIFDDYVVKFFHDENLVRQRVERGRVLEGLVPAIQGSTKNFYKYEFAEGDLYADVANPSNFGEFLAWSQINLWKKTKEVKKEEFKQVCFDFYHTKTTERIDKLLASRSLKDETTTINGVSTPPVKELLKEVDFDWLCQAEQSYFHGDFILDNILKTSDGFRLLDWRQNFGGLTKAGDRYYDLAKLNHNLTVNHGIISDNLYTIKIKGKTIECDILRKATHVECQRVLFEFLSKNGYDAKKVKVLTAIIWLNMSPLHHHPFDLFLFYFGKLSLWSALHEYETTQKTST